MYKYLIIYNIIFLLLGNVLIPNIHHLSDHYHGGDHYDCEECIIFKYSDNYISDFKEVKFQNNITFQLVFEYFSIIKFRSVKIYSSRAPPIS